MIIRKFFGKKIIYQLTSYFETSIVSFPAFLYHMNRSAPAGWFRYMCITFHLTPLSTDSVHSIRCHLVMTLLSSGMLISTHDILLHFSFSKGVPISNTTDGLVHLPNCKIIGLSLIVGSYAEQCSIYAGPRNTERAIPMSILPINTQLISLIRSADMTNRCTSQYSLILR